MSCVETDEGFGETKVVWRQRRLTIGSLGL
jgi:hypothetical protein